MDHIFPHCIDLLQISATSSFGRDTAAGYAGGCPSLRFFSAFLGLLCFGRASRSSGLSTAEITPRHPQVWRTESSPMRAPRCLGSAAMVIMASAEALNRMS
jgi:hypothetical protein